MPFTKPQADGGGLTVIMCLAFDHRAPVEGLRAFKEGLIACPFVDVSMEVSGTFDFIVQAHIPDAAVYGMQLERLSPLLRQYVSRYEASFVCRKFEKADGSDGDGRFPDCFWVPDEHGVQRVDVAAIDKITAERDYMRLHFGDRSCLMHITTRSLLEKLDPDEFLHIHRSVIVRKGFIERLVHEGRHWEARLRDGTTQNVSKSRIAPTLERLWERSSNQKLH